MMKIIFAQRYSVSGKPQMKELFIKLVSLLCNSWIYVLVFTLYLRLINITCLIHEFCETKYALAS